MSLGECKNRTDVRHCLNPCSAAELDSCNSVLWSSASSMIKLLPNHHIGQDAQLHGFHFTCSATDLAGVLPVGKDVCSMISMYEVLKDDEITCCNTLDILNNHVANQAKLDTFVQQLDADTTMPARFDCIAQQLEQSVHQAAEFDSVDSRPWKEEISDKVGIYHTFTRSMSKHTRRHNVFIVVSGCLSEAAEEFHNLWQDAGNELTCQELLNCEELNWLRSTTHRNHNRVASQISRLFGLRMHHVADTDDPSHAAQLVFPTTSTYKSDMRKSEGANVAMTRYVDGGCFADLCNNGILLEMYGTEGFWLFQGPRDFADNYPYGSIFANTNEAMCMPTCTVEYHNLFPAPNTHNNVQIASADKRSHRTYLFPDERFFSIIQELGFNCNDGMLNLMPLVYHERKR